MSVFNVRDVRIIEGDDFSKTLEFTVFADQAVSARTELFYFLQGRTASEQTGDFNDRDGAVVFSAGQSSRTVSITIYGDANIEANELFDLYLIAGQNAELAGSAAALRAQATIIDDDGGPPSLSEGFGDLAEQISGGPSSSSVLPTVSIRDTTIVEGDEFSSTLRFLVTLDRPATTPVSISYYLEDKTASSDESDYNDRDSVITIPAGGQATWIEVTVYGGSVIEQDEQFQLIVTNASNAVLSGNAAALVATATILDDDGGSPSTEAGIGGFASEIDAPESASSVLPTFSARNVDVLEGDSFSQTVRVMLMLDQVASSNVTGNFYLQGVTAEDSLDYNDRSGSFTISAGTQTGYLEFTVYSDSIIEGDESFEIVFTNINNAVFSANAQALVATATIRDDDGGSFSGAGGFGDFADEIFGPASASSSLPTVSVRDAEIIEGDGFSQTVRFLVLLDQPSPTTINFQYALNGGSASDSLGDFNQTSGAATINAGTESTWLEFTVYGDSLIEGDEDFSLVLSGISNGVFEGNAPALVATATILDDDSGPVSGPAGIGDPAAQVAAPPPGPGGSTTMEIVDVSVSEGDGFTGETARVYVLFSQPLTSSVTVDYETIAGTATADADFNSISGRTTIAAGVQSTYFNITIYGDSDIEGDESFSLRLTNLSGATFSDGSLSQDATILIRDNDSLNGTAGSEQTGPEFSFQEAATNGDDVITGTPNADFIDGLDGNDTIEGLAGNDTIFGGAGNDRVFDGRGNDTVDLGADNDIVRVGGGRDSFDGGSGRDLISYYDAPNGVTVNLRTDTVSRSSANDDTIANFENVSGSRTGDDVIYGTTVTDDEGGANTIRTYGGNDRVFDYSGDDTVELGSGNDAVRVGGGQDSFDGGSGRDFISYYDSTNGVTVDLRRDLASGSWANDDTVVNFESISGSRTGDDVIYGTTVTDDEGGDNTIRTYGGNDRVFDYSGDDTVELGSGNDYVRVGGGEDSFDGGSGIDYISYYSSTNGVTVNLRTDTVSGSWAENDTVANFESISGSRTGDDVIYGTTVADDAGGDNVIRTYGGNDRVFDYSGDDTVELGSGDDYVRVGGGEDSFDGGSGTDFISYYSSSNGVRLDFAADTAALSWADNDTVVNFEGASGSRTGDDDLRGDENENVFRGNGGEDRLLGRDGDDRLFGGDDNDRLFGGNDNDELYGDDGDDFLHGGKGNDDLYGGTGSDIFHFDRGDGDVTVHDFENNIDVFQFDNFTGAATSSNQAFFDAYVRQQGNDVIFDFGADGTLTVADTTVGLVRNDFELV